MHQFRFYTHGVLNVLGDRPCFAMPIFTSEATPSSYFAQVIGNDETIESFEPLASLPASLVQVEKIERGLGDVAIFSFFVSPGNIILGERRDVQNALRTIGMMEMAGPFLALELADFLGAREASDRALEDATDFLARFNDKAAQDWRKAQYRVIDTGMAGLLKSSLRQRNKEILAGNLRGRRHIDREEYGEAAALHQIVIDLYLSEPIAQVDSREIVRTVGNSAYYR